MVLIGGFFLIIAAGSESRIRQGKELLTTAIIAIVIVLAAWILINTVVFFLTGQQKEGVATILTKPWNEIDCPIEGVCSGCGDGVVQPNEDCDPNESEAGFLARGDDLNGDGDCNHDDYLLMKFLCIDCKIACKDSPGLERVGEACWMSSDPGDRDGTHEGSPYCQRGKYACDTDPASPTYDLVICADVYGDPSFISHPDYIGKSVYDECCVDAGAALPGMVGEFSIVKCDPATTDCDNFNCDEICKEAVNGLCIGVGLTNVAGAHCVHVHHHSGDCINSVNLQENDCRGTFHAYGPTCPESGSPWVPIPHFHRGWNTVDVGETACYCR
jgi:hypothetical protein